MFLFFQGLSVLFSLAGWVFIILSIVLNVRARRRKLVRSTRQRWQWWITAMVCWALCSVCYAMAARFPEPVDPLTAQFNAALANPDAASSVLAPDTASGESPTDRCVDRWVDAYRKEVGQDTVVTQDQLNEWTQWCQAGKQAP